MDNLIKYKKNIYSQHGEDGIIEEILRRLDNHTDKQYCEFGALDGLHLSNTCNLLKKNQCKALLIEPNKDKFQELCKNFPQEKITKINSFVEIDGNKSLDNFLEKNNFNKNFDFLSIDIDSYDYYIFESLKNFNPKVVCIEYNPTIPNEVSFVQKKKQTNHGSSAKALIDMASKKNYFVVCATKSNLFFIHSDFKKYVIGDKTYKINDLIDDTDIKNYIFYGYDGSIFTSKEVKLPWHNFLVKDLNVLKGFLRKYPRNYNYIEKLIFKVYRKIKKYI